MNNEMSIIWITEFVWVDMFVASRSQHVSVIAFNKIKQYYSK
jgi:hypothetical protein